MACSFYNAGICDVHQHVNVYDRCKSMMHVYGDKHIVRVD